MDEQDPKPRHFRLKADPMQLGVEGQPLGKVAPRPEHVKPRFMVRLQMPGGGAEDVPIYSPEEAVNESITTYERKRLLATALVAQSRQVHAVAAPPGRGAPQGEVERLRERVNELENRPRRRLWFLVVDGAESYCEEAVTKAAALEQWKAKHAGDLPIVTEATSAEVDELLAANARAIDSLAKSDRRVREALKLIEVDMVPEVAKQIVDSPPLHAFIRSVIAALSA